MTGHCSQYDHSGRLTAASAAAPSHHVLDSTPGSPKSTSDGLIDTRTPGHAQRTAPAPNAAIHISVLPKRIWAGPFGNAMRASRMTHVQGVGRHHQIT